MEFWLSAIKPYDYKTNHAQQTTQLSTKLILLINVKMPTIVGILTFMSRINTTSESFEARNIVIFKHSNYFESGSYILS